MSKVSTLDRQMYSVPEAARLLDLPPTTLRWWLEGKQRGEKDYAPVIRPKRTGSDLVTWGEFVEAGLLREYRRKKVSLQKMRPFIEGIRHRLGFPYPLAHVRPDIDLKTAKLIYDLQNETTLPPSLYLIDFEHGQTQLAEPIKQYLDHVEFADAGPAIRYWPRGKDSPISIDPEIAFGLPQIRGVRTESIAESVEAGESTEQAGRSWGVSRTEVEAALLWERRHSNAA